MQISKKMLIPMAAVAIVGAGMYGAAQVSAAADTTDPRTSLIQKLADTFHVDKSKVQAVFDEQHTQMQADREKDYEAQLTQAVEGGELTSAQKTSVLAERKKLAAKIEAIMKDDSTDTREERRAAMDKVRTEGQDWAKANNIDAKWLMGGGGGHMHGPGGPMMDRHGHNDRAPQ
jgi:hypothetical protein